MQTTTKRLLVIGQGLNALDTAKLTGPNAARLRLAAARNRRTITHAVDDLEAARKLLIRDLTGGKEEIEGGSPLIKKFQAAMDVALEAPVDVKMWALSWKDLETAELSPSALEQLWPILKDVPEADESLVA